MIKVGEHITLDIIGTTKEYDPSVYERVIHKIAKAADVTILNIKELLKKNLIEIQNHFILTFIVLQVYKNLMS